MSRPTAIVIAGPTASGKSGLAARIAAEFGGTVINADSMQVYDGLAVLTAQPGEAERRSAPHKLYGLLGTEQICSAARWAQMAKAEVTEAWAAGRLPVVVGGTGLYLRALMQGLSPVPEIPAEIREATRDAMTQLGPAAFHARLATRDPVMAARLRPSDPQRLARAWEVLDATGQSLAHWQTLPLQGGMDAAWHSILLAPDRQALYQACDGRFRTMVAHGALDEARAMARMALAPDLPATKALGLRELTAHLAGEITLDDAIATAQQATRNYAKRQVTWFRHQFSADQTISAQLSESLIATIFMKIRQPPLTTA